MMAPLFELRVLLLAVGLAVLACSMAEPVATQSLSEEAAKELLTEAQAAASAQDFDRAIALYTKLLQNDGHGHQQHAQEYLGVAREHKGQHAHAIAEYRKYLETYTVGEGVKRVRQRLAVLLTRKSANSAEVPIAENKPGLSVKNWNTRTRISQFYRRHGNQFNNEDRVVSQSAIQSDLDLTAKRDGNRVDFSSRVSAGYTLDQLPDDEGPGNINASVCCTHNGTTELPEHRPDSDDRHATGVASFSNRAHADDRRQP